MLAEEQIKNKDFKDLIVKMKQELAELQEMNSKLQTENTKVQGESQIVGEASTTNEGLLQEIQQKLKNKKLKVKLFKSKLERISKDLSQSQMEAQNLRDFIANGSKEQVYE